MSHFAVRVLIFIQEVYIFNVLTFRAAKCVSTASLSKFTTSSVGFFFCRYNTELRYNSS